ncbi:MAG: chemotaxis protein CheA, partial [Thermodesulfobacteriota bacterium]|nr:chemotaxis protein CheA [Thermodesulfobacteriota bacterium]
MADTGEGDLAAGANSEFIAEIKDDLELLEPDLLTMEEEGGAVGADLINHAFRAIHSIKGGAGFCGLKDLGALSHSMENVLMHIRDGRLVITPELVDALLYGLDKLKLMVDSLESEEPMFYEDEVKILENILSSEEKKEDSDLPGKTETRVISSEKSEVFQQSGEYDSEKFMIVQTSEDSFFNSRSFHVKRDEIEKSVNDGKFIYAVHFDSNRDFIKKERRPADIVNDIENAGEALFFDLDPNLEEFEIKEKSQGFNLVISTILDLDFIAEVLEVPISEIYLFDPSSFDFSISVKPDALDGMDDGSEEETVKEETVKEETVKEETVKEETVKAETVKEEIVKAETVKAEAVKEKVFLKKDGKAVRETKKAAETIRVNVDLITRLMNLAGELVLSRNQLRPLVEEYSRENAVVTSVMQNLDMVTTDIQEDIMQMRMQPVDKLLGRFKRIVRDTAKKLSKKVDYIVEGGDVELDRTVLEGLSNPMTHLMRNCVDHGIESPDHRKKAGKSETGTISVKAFHQGGNVHINIFDDGKGIDPEKIVSAAMEKGVITEAFADTMSDKEKIDLIFSPGFSTSDEVTAVSGRGVGMDVVKTNIKELRGHIDIDSIPGHGTT